MLFNSVEFFLFLAVVYGLYVVLGHRAQNRLLLFASYFFYGWWDVRFLMLILLSTAVDYAASLAIAGHRLGRRQLFLGSALLGAGAFLFLGPHWPAVLGGRFEPGRWLAGFELLPLLGPCLGAAFLLPVLYGTLDRIRDVQRRRRAFLLASVVTNLGMLGCFKYYDFFIVSLEGAAASLGLDVELLHLNIVLPVGISFYTFQTMGYTIDVYRGHLTPTRKFSSFSLYVAFFPQLVAGPIERGARLLPEIVGPRNLSPEQFREGFFLIAWGLFKKVLVADQCAFIVNSVFANHEQYGALSLIVAVCESVPQIGSFLAGIFGDFRLSGTGVELLARLGLLAGPLMLVELLQAIRADPFALLNLRNSWRAATVLGLGFWYFLYWVLFQSALTGGREFIYFQF